MKIIKWHPFNNIVDEFFEPASHNLGDGGTGTWAPAVDVYETQEKIVLTAELPGVNQGDIDLTIMENILILKGERRFEKDVNKENYHIVERNYGAFCRRFAMPCEVDGKKITADFKDGVLRVMLPKAGRTKKISVKLTR